MAMIDELVAAKLVNIARSL